MGTRTEYGPDTFCWVNLSTPDPGGARRFYGALLGWDFLDGTGDGGFWFARRYGANVAAIYPLEEQERARGLQPHWNNYVNVTDVDAAAERAVDLGGSVWDGPFDVTDAGRTAVLLDPTGAMFWVWQPKAHIGAGHVNDPGCLTWNELDTRDPERAIAFYSELFGWTFDPSASKDGRPNWVIRNPAAAGGRNGGLRAPSKENGGHEPAWIPFFTVESAAAALRTAVTSGGRHYEGAGRPDADATARLTDPYGASFGLFQGVVDG